MLSLRYCLKKRKENVFCMYFFYYRTNLLEDTNSRNQNSCFKKLLPQHLVAQWPHCLPVRCNQLPDFVHVVPPPTPVFLLGLLIHDPLFICWKSPTKVTKNYLLLKLHFTGKRPSVMIWNDTMRQSEIKKSRWDKESIAFISHYCASLKCFPSWSSTCLKPSFSVTWAILWFKNVCV